MKHKWKCPECAAEAEVDVWWYANNGTPMCGECDIDMLPAEEQPTCEKCKEYQYVLSTIKENLIDAEYDDGNHPVVAEVIEMIKNSFPDA